MYDVVIAGAGVIGGMLARELCKYNLKIIISVSVKTEMPVPKENVFDVMKIIHSSVASAPVKIGDIIVCDVYGSNIVATSEIE